MTKTLEERIINLSDANPQLVDSLDTNHPLVIKHVEEKLRDLQEENKKLKSKLDLIQSKLIDEEPGVVCLRINAILKQKW